MKLIPYRSRKEILTEVPKAPSGLPTSDWDYVEFDNRQSQVRPEEITIDRHRGVVFVFSVEQTKRNGEPPLFYIPLRECTFVVKEKATIEYDIPSREEFLHMRGVEE